MSIPDAMSLTTTLMALGPVAAVRASVSKHIYGLLQAFGAARTTQGDAIWISGREKSSGEMVRLFYFGTGRSLDHIIDRLYSEHVVESRTSGLRAWTARGALRAAASRADLLIADLPWPYCRWVAGPEFIRIPGWIIQEIRLPREWDAVVAGFRKNTRTTDLRKIRKFKLTFRLTKEQSEVDTFYDSMYAPYAVHRFGKLAVVDPRPEVTAAMEFGGLLQVMHEDRAVAGVIVTQHQTSMHFLWFGLPVDLEGPLADAALSGLYYFSIQHAFERGCTDLNLSFTLPLLNDGVYRYKRKWGARVRKAWALEEILFRPLHLKTPVTSFFANQPLIVRDGEQLIGKVLVNKLLASPEELSQLVDSYASPGLSRIDVYSMHCLDAGVRAGADGHDIEVRLLDLSQSPDPLSSFCAP